MGASATAHDSGARAWAVLPLLLPTDDRCFFLRRRRTFPAVVPMSDVRVGSRSPSGPRKNQLLSVSTDDCLRGCGRAKATMRYRIEPGLIGSKGSAMQHVAICPAVRFVRMKTRHDCGAEPPLKKRQDSASAGTVDRRGLECEGKLRGWLPKTKPAQSIHRAIETDGANTAMWYQVAQDDVTIKSKQTPYFRQTTTLFRKQSSQFLQ